MSCARGIFLSRLVTLTLDARLTDVFTDSYLAVNTAPKVLYFTSQDLCGRIDLIFLKLPPLKSPELVMFDSSV